MSYRTLTAVTFCTTLAAAGAAYALPGPRGTESEQVNSAVFEVGARGSGTSDDLWCGAADFARRALGAGWKTKIYVARGRGKGVVTNRGVTAHFTLDPAAAGITPIPQGQSYNTLAVGYSMTVTQGNKYCSFPPDLWF